MDEVVLVADHGRPSGSRASRRLRREGKVPGVLYGHGTDPTSLAVDARDLRHALSGEAGVNALLSLKVGETTHLALARQIQRHPVRGSVDHVDFQVVRRDEVVSAEIPLHLVGEASEVAMADGRLDQQLFALTIHARPGDIPNAIEVDVSAMAVGDAIRVGDLVLPNGVSTEASDEEPIVVAQAAQAAEVAEAETEEGAAAEPGAASEGGSPGAAGSGGASGSGEG
ncbi:MAG: 50S ribosomal protein L25 [Acidimicrobiales bacterium]